MKDTVGIGIVGSGFAQTTQIPGFAHAPGARLVAISSGRRSSAEAAAERFQIPNVFDDYEGVAAHPQVDLVVISSPPYAHRDAALAAAGAGKHILCEKPMAMDAGQAREMAEAARLRGVLALIDHEMRFSPNRRAVKRLVDEGYLGRVSHVTAVYRNGGRAKPGTFNWWSSAAAGGGLLGALGSHMIDAMRWWVGEVEEVDCRMRTFVTERPEAGTGELKRVETDDFASLRLGLAGAVTAEISLSAVAQLEGEHRFEFIGSEAALVLDEERGTLTGWRGGVREELTEADPAKGLDGIRDNAWARAFVHFAREIVAAVREGRREVDGAATFDDGARIQEVLDAARRSNDAGRRESV